MQRAGDRSAPALSWFKRAGDDISGSEEDEEDEEGEEGAAGLSGEAWLDALSDAQLLTAQRAFVAAVGNCLDFLEAVRAEASRWLGLGLRLG